MTVTFNESAVTVLIVLIVIVCVDNSVFVILHSLLIADSNAVMPLSISTFMCSNSNSAPLPGRCFMRVCVCVCVCVWPLSHSHRQAIHTDTHTHSQTHTHTHTHTDTHPHSHTHTLRGVCSCSLLRNVDVKAGALVFCGGSLLSAHTHTHTLSHTHTPISVLWR